MPGGRGAHHAGGMLMLRGIGWVLLLLGAIVLGRDLIAWRDAPVFAPLSLLGFWRALGGPSIENGGALLSVWAAPAFLVPGLALLWIGRKRRAAPPRRRRPRHRR